MRELVGLAAIAGIIAGAFGPAAATEDAAGLYHHALAVMRALPAPGAMAFRQHIEGRYVRAACDRGADAGIYSFEQGGRSWRGDVVVEVDDKGVPTATLSAGTCSGFGLFTPAVGYARPRSRRAGSVQVDDIVQNLLAQPEPKGRVTVTGHDAIDGAAVTRLAIAPASTQERGDQDDLVPDEVAIDDATGRIRFAHFATGGWAGIAGGAQVDIAVTFAPVATAWVVKSYHFSTLARVAFLSRRWQIDVTNEAVPARHQSTRSSA